MSSELQAAVIGALVGGAFVLVAVVLQQALTVRSEKNQRKGEFQSLLLFLSWELQIIEASVLAKEPTVRFTLASLTWLVDRGFLGSLPAKLRDGVLAIGTTVQIANDMRDVIGVPPELSRADAMLHAMQFGDYRQRLEEALKVLREQVPLAITELNQLLPKFKVKVSIDTAPARTPAPTPDSAAGGQQG